MKKLFKDVDGLRIECLVSAGISDPVFIFHGNSSEASAYEALLNSDIGKKYQLIAVSFPGHGESSYYTNEPDYVSIAMLGQFTAKLVQQFNPQRYLLIGQSLGGHALLEALHLHPNAAGLCLVSAPPFSLSTISKVFREDPTGGLLFSNELDEAGVERFADAFIHNPNPEIKNSLKESIRKTRGKFRAHLGNSLAQGLLEDELAALAKAAIPTLVLQAEKDQFLNNDYYESLLQQQLPIDLVAFENCGHAIQLDSPKAFQKTIALFIQQHLNTRNTTQQLQQEKELQHA